jgi:hypothetical protein
MHVDTTRLSKGLGTLMMVQVKFGKQIMAFQLTMGKCLRLKGEIIGQRWIVGY